MPSPLKIELFTRYHSGMHCKVCPKRLAAHPETPEQIERKQSAAEDPARTVSRYQIDRAGIIQRYAVQRRPIPTGTGADRRTVQTESARNDHAKPEQLATVRPRRIFCCSPVRGVCSRFTAHLLPCKEVLSAAFLRWIFRIAPNVYLWKFIKQQKPRICLLSANTRHFRIIFVGNF